MKPLGILLLTLTGLGSAFALLLALPPSAAPVAQTASTQTVSSQTSSNQPPDKRAAAQVALGRRLFFDPVLSRDRTLSCSSCHSPQAAFADPGGLAISPGVENRRGRRNAISLINAADRKALTWAGTSASLETQAMIPITDHAELDMSVEETVARLKADTRYVAEFQQAYGQVPSMQNTVKALSSFERTLISRNSRYDKYQAGDANALNAQEVRGLDLFFGKADCFHCHTGRDFSDGLPHNNASLLFNPDTGLAERSGKDEDVGKFITPSLRNVGITAPYMHNGSFKTLQDVVEQYNDGAQPNPNADPLIRPLGLTDGEVADVVAFLNTLTDSSIAQNPAFQAAR